MNRLSSHVHNKQPEQALCYKMCSQGWQCCYNKYCYKYTIGWSKNKDSYVRKLVNSLTAHFWSKWHFWSTWQPTNQSWWLQSQHASNTAAFWKHIDQRCWQRDFILVVSVLWFSYRMIIKIDNARSKFHNSAVIYVLISEPFRMIYYYMALQAFRIQHHRHFL